MSLRPKNWANLLPFTLLGASYTPCYEGFTPFEIMFGSPPFPCNKLKYVHEAEITNCSLKSLQVLQQARRAIHQTIQGTMPLSMSEHAHKFQSYNLVWVKRILTGSLEPLWKSSYPVVPSTPTQCHPMNPPCLARKPRQMGHHQVL